MYALLCLEFPYFEIIFPSLFCIHSSHTIPTCQPDEFKSFLKRLPSTHFLPIGSVHLLWGSDWDLQARYRLLQSSLEIQRLKIQRTARKLFSLSIRCHHNPNHQMPRERWVGHPASILTWKIDKPLPTSIKITLFYYSYKKQHQTRVSHPWGKRLWWSRGFISIVATWSINRNNVIHYIFQRMVPLFLSIKST